MPKKSFSPKNLFFYSFYNPQLEDLATSHSAFNSPSVILSMSLVKSNFYRLFVEKKKKNKKS